MKDSKTRMEDNIKNELNLLERFIKVIEESRQIECIQLLKCMEECKKKWLQTQLELKTCKENLLKTDMDKSALEVKLKHARNQVDVEMRKRHKAESDLEYLKRQMQLICDILMYDGQSSDLLNDEQKSLLANFNNRGGIGLILPSNKRLSVIDESCNSTLFHSDISYDRTDDDLDLETSVIKHLKPRPRDRRRTSFAPAAGLPVQPKRCRPSGCSGDLFVATTTENIKECIVSRTTVNMPENSGSSKEVSALETGPKRKSFRSRQLSTITEQTTVWTASEESVNVTCAENETVTKVRSSGSVFSTEETAVHRHIFVSKTCTLSDYVSQSSPMIPSLVVQCVNEIEKRGLQEVGIYRVPGCDRIVKELKEKYVRGKGLPPLGKVEDIHVVCGLLKDFLRKLKEPIVTFRLHKTFINAGLLNNTDESIAAICQAIEELPQPNRDTLAFIILHLQRVMKSPDCKMDLNNLSRVFGPTIVGHSVPDPTPVEIMRETAEQPKVVARLLSLSEEYWKQFLMVENDQVISSVINTNINTQGNYMEKGRLFKPLTSPEMNCFHKTPSSGSLCSILTSNSGTASTPLLSNKAKSEQAKKKFFTSPTLK
ncbi:rac GTPase-activating protein 1 isoform X6 [Erpetoichthys calabaricus]|uniref:rac GTPase-activating protein 1 isoform X6 n=1 Tax=Erpetoichthys calabaricus TaxID=27687 RepID=UPI0022345472|nr:rac GTPase-activating protein 1 isoform X6 [Erpetoichthys calabaricus]